jgi:hypothetical protein
MIIFSLIHPILCGIAGFAATVIGSTFFNLEDGYFGLLLGILLFVFTNQIMLKFQFNSYQLNGATITTILTFLTQVTCITIYKRNEIGYKWVLGVFAILLGTILLKTSKR